jgi:effector-binding domain-containing protein
VPAGVVSTSVAPLPTAVVARTTTWEELPSLWPRLLDEVYRVVRPRPELSPATGPAPQWHNVMLYKDDAPNVEVGVLVGAAFEADGEVVPSRLPGGTVVTTTHRGDYAGLGDAHDAVHRFAADNGLALTRTRWEIYGHPGEDGSDPEVGIYWLVG